MRTLIIFAIALLIVSSVAAGPLATKTMGKLTVKADGNNALDMHAAGNYCDVCIALLQTAIQELINAIIDIPIEDGCGALCSFLPNSLEGAVCTILCEIKGINEFERIIQEVNPDPIAACMALEVCPVNQYAKGRVTSLTVSPIKGAQGTTFTVNMNFAITNTTGTGQILIQINPPGQNSNAFGNAETFQKLAPGPYTTSLQISTEPSQDQPFNPGNYQVIGAVCEGTCGGTSKWAYIIGQAATIFTLTP